MTPTTHSPGTPGSRTAIGVEPATPDGERRRRTAVAALLHRINGGLNNASMAFELALAAQRGDERVVQAGLGGVNQSARALALLSELLTPGSTNASLGVSVTLSDVTEMLRASAMLRGVALRIEGEPAHAEDALTTPALAVASLLEGLAAVEEAPPATCVSLAASHNPGGLRLRVPGTTKAAAP